MARVFILNKKLEVMTMCWKLNYKGNENENINKQKEH